MYVCIVHRRICYSLVFLFKIIKFICYYMHGIMNRITELGKSISDEAINRQKLRQQYEDQIKELKLKYV